MKFSILKKYVSIPNYLLRFTIIKFRNIHIRIHKIVDIDRTDFFHNHPFDYISIVLKGGYTESIIDGNKEIIIKNNRWKVIKRKHDIPHRIINIIKPTYTLFIAYNKYEWKLYNNGKENSLNGIYKRIIKGVSVYSKVENGIWFIGHIDKTKALEEVKHSIFQNEKYYVE